jgi:zinc protease
LNKIQNEGVQPSELEKAVKQTKAQFAYSSESVTNQGYWLGFSQVVASLAWLDQWLEQLTAVTAEDVRRVAQIYFTPSRQTVGWYIPQ